MLLDKNAQDLQVTYNRYSFRCLADQPSLAYHEVRSRSGPIGPRVKLSLRLLKAEGRGRFGILKGDRRGRTIGAGCRRRSGVITENGRVFAAITGTTVTKQRHRHTTLLGSVSAGPSVV